MTESQGVGQILEQDKLETAVCELQRNLRCLRRALSLMLVMAAFATAGLCYCVVFLPDFPERFDTFLMQFAVKGFCAVGLASLACFLVFSALHFVYRSELGRKREAHRQYLVGVSLHQ